MRHKSSQFRSPHCGTLVCNMNVFISSIERWVAWMDMCIWSDETNVFNLDSLCGLSPKQHRNRVIHLTFLGKCQMG